MPLESSTTSAGAASPPSVTLCSLRLHRRAVHHGRVPSHAWLTPSSLRFLFLYLYIYLVVCVIGECVLRYIRMYVMCLCVLCVKVWVCLICMCMYVCNRVWEWIYRCSVYVCCGWVHVLCISFIIFLVYVNIFTWLYVCMWFRVAEIWISNRRPKPILDSYS